MIFLKKIIAALLVSVMFLFAGCGASDNGGVIGSVNGQDVYQDEMDYYFAYYFEYYYQNYYSYYLSYMGVDLLDEESASSILGDFEKSAWDATVNAALIEQMAAEYGLTYEDNYLKDILPWGDYRTIKVGSLNSQLYDAVKQAMLDEMVVDESQAKAAYDEDPASWDCRKTSHILLMCDTSDEAALAEAKAKAEDIIKQLNEGADFAELAKEYSDDGSAANGGAIDSYFNINCQVIGESTTFYPEYVEAAFELQNAGDYTLVPVLSQAGYHIIKLDDVKSGFDAVKDMVMDSMKTVSDEEVSARMNADLEEARANADIKQKFKFRYYQEEATQPDTVDDGNQQGGDTPEDQQTDNNGTEDGGDANTAE